MSAGELITEYVFAKSAGIKLDKLSFVLHVYPTLAQVVKRSADQYYINMMSSGWVKALSRFFIKLMR